MFDLLGTRSAGNRSRAHTIHGGAGRGDGTVPGGRAVPDQRLPPRIDTEAQPRPAPAPASLPPSVARLAARTRLSAELLAALLEVDGRAHATLDDMERADALADVLLARRRQRVVQRRSGS